MSSCTSVQIYSDYDRTIDFNHYKTYAWITKSDSAKNLFNNQIVEKNLKYYTDQEMAARGYKMDAQSPDVLLEYHITSQKKSYTTSTPIYNNSTFYNNPYYYNNGGNWYSRPYYFNNTPNIIGYNYQQVEYNEGTLLLDIVDRKLNQLVWRGWSVGTLNDVQTFEVELSGDIHQIFQKYPVPTPRMVKLKKKLSEDDQY
jgi:hypothetical protein